MSGNGRSTRNSSGQQTIATNRRAHYEYEILETFEAGLVLHGSEVKAIRTNGMSIAEGFARVTRGEVWLENVMIPPYDAASYNNLPSRRPRKLLLHRREIQILAQQVQKDGLTLVPLRVYYKRGRVKIGVALARGKRLYDKRQSIAARDAERDVERALAERQSD